MLPRKKHRTKTTVITSGVSRRLVTMRKKLNLTSPEMAARLGITGSAYNKYELGHNLPGVGPLIKLQKDFDISLDWLYFNKGPMKFTNKLKSIDLEKEAERLNTEALRLKEEEERLKKLEEKLKRRGEGAARFSELEAIMPDITDLLEKMAVDPQLRHKILLDFYTYNKKSESPVPDPANEGKDG